jgi:hypothetical protein
MALAYLNPSEEHMTYDDIVDQLGGLTSIWTIDLGLSYQYNCVCHHLVVDIHFWLAKIINVALFYFFFPIHAALLLGKIIGTDRFAFCTSTVGVKETYRLIDFYKKELDSDAVRVNRLFKEASANGVNVVHRTLSSNSIRDLLLSGQVVIIMLIDLSHLKKDMDSEVYRGHFILLCGYRHETAEFAYQDPASADGHVCFVKVDTLDTARKSEGTDEDLLIIRTTSTLTEAETAEDEADHGRVVRCCK